MGLRKNHIRNTVAGASQGGVPKGRAKKLKYIYNKAPKGTFGEQAWYMPHDKAIKKLQLTPEEFLRICIYKGVHPREPRKRFGKPNQTYYHTKDIEYLKNDPILQTFAEMKVFDRKFKRLIFRKDFERAKNYKNWMQPYLNLARVVKERHPTFEEAVKCELEDCLSTLCLVAGLPADEQTELKGGAIAEVRKLLDEFYWMMAQLNLIKKGFISQKGFYLTANVAGYDITWLQPFEYALDTSEIVDFSPMKYFSEFYVTLLKFVNFKLYHDHDFAYPPKCDSVSSGAGYRFLSIIDSTSHNEDVDEDNESGEANNNSMDDDNEDGIKDDDNDDVKEEEEFQKVKPLEGVKVFINREVPLQVFALVLRSMGATVGWQEKALTTKQSSPFTKDDQSITYHILDRPTLPAEAKTTGRNRSYVQPQWVFDTLNAGSIATLEDYSVGKELPIHYSPYHEYVAPEDAEKAEKEAEEAEEGEERKLRKSMMDSKARWLYGLKDRKKKLGLK